MSLAWAPIDDLPSDWSLLASGELRPLAAVWKEQKQALAGSSALREFNEHLTRQWAIETGILERIYELDRGITELLIDRGIDAALIPDDATNRDPEIVATIIRDHEASMDFLFAVVDGTRTLSTSFVKDLHALITRHQDAATGRDMFGRKVEVLLLRGEWKLRPNDPTRADGTLHEYCPPEQVGPQMERLLALHDEHQTEGVVPEIEAAWLHHRFTQIHPFQDGNGRVARGLASLVLIKAGWFPLVVTRDDRERYISALESADRGDLRPLVTLVEAVQRKAFVDALGIARVVMREDERVDQVIQSVRDLFGARHEDLRREWEQARWVADEVLQVGAQRLGTLADKLKDELGPVAAESRFFVDVERNGGERRNWYRWQTIKAARALGYHANFRDYSAWVRLGLHTESRADVLLSFSAIGHDFRGLVGVALVFFRRAEVDDSHLEVTDVAAASDELFQINYKEAMESVIDRFCIWLDRSTARALEMWRRTL